jgi:hypothetical protein
MPPRSSSLARFARCHATSRPSACNRRLRSTQRQSHQLARLGHRPASRHHALTSIRPGECLPHPRARCQLGVLDGASQRRSTRIRIASRRTTSCSSNAFSRKRPEEDEGNAASAATMLSNEDTAAGRSLGLIIRRADARESAKDCAAPPCESTALCT